MHFKMDCSCCISFFQEWLSKYNNGDFLSLLKKHWKTFVPVVYASGYDTAKEERLANRLLFVPLETFICNGDPKTVFEELKSKDKPAQICGHVFKNGEPTYSCRFVILIYSKLIIKILLFYVSI